MKIQQSSAVKKMVQKHFIPPLQFLCLDDDDDFMAFIKSAATPYNLIIHSAFNCKEAYEKLRARSFDGYIIDLNIPDGSGLDIIKEVRRSKSKTCPIAAVSGIMRDEKTFRTLKEMAVEYVLEKPISNEQVKNLLFALSHTKSEEAAHDKTLRSAALPGSEGGGQEKGREGHGIYDEMLCDRIDQLTALVREVEHYPNKTNLQKLKEVVLDTGDSAAVYGYQEAGSLCKNLAQDIDEYLSTSSEDARLFFSLKRFIKDLKYYYQVKSKVSFALTKQGIPPQFSRLSLYIINQNAEFLEALQKKAKLFSIDLAVETNPAVALEHLQAEDFNPRTVIVAQQFTSTDVSSANIIATIRDKSLPIFIGMILDQDSTSVRLQALQQGVNIFFVQPVAPRFLLETILEVLVLGDLTGFKALVIDDDIDSRESSKEALVEIGVEVRQLKDPNNLFETLEEYKPQLLVLDVVITHQNGFYVLKTLRADPAYNKMIIIVTSFLRDSQTRLTAYSSCADEILFKPIDKKLLQMRVINLVRRKSAYENSSSFTRVLSHSTPIDQLHQLEGFLDAEQSHFSYMVLIEADIATQDRRAVAARGVISKVAASLEASASDDMVYYNYREQLFTLLFKQASLDEVETKLFNMLASLLMECQNKVIFTCHIVSLAHPYVNAYELLKAAEEGLKNALKDRGTGPIKISVAQRGPEQAVVKEIILIDPDLDLVRLLKAAFEFHHFSVKTFSEGNEALNDLLNRQERQLPALIISERRLPDMDGLEVLSRLKTRFHTPILLYFLTIYASDKDISEGLRYGATDYIAKPVNISILMQKALKTIAQK